VSDTRVNDSPVATVRANKFIRFEARRKRWSQVAREAEETAREMKGVKGSKSEGERERGIAGKLARSEGKS